MENYIFFKYKNVTVVYRIWLTQKHKSDLVATIGVWVMVFNATFVVHVVRWSYGSWVYNYTCDVAQDVGTTERNVKK